MGDDNTYITPENDPFGTYELVVQIGDCPSESQFVIVEPRLEADYTVEINSNNPSINILSSGVEFSVSAVPAQTTSLQYDWHKDGDSFIVTSQSSINLTEEGDYFVIVTDNSGECPVSAQSEVCLLYTSPSPRDGLLSRMPSSA